MSTRASRLEALYVEQEKCTTCPRLVGCRKRVVRGRGNPDARIVFIGEGPGEDEDNEGFASVGRVGKFLDDELLGKIGIGDPEEDFYIVNAVACRPAVMNVLRGKMENVQPTFDEMQNCRKWLHQIIRIIDPFCLILAGGIPCQAFGLRKSITSMQGRPVDVQVDGVGRSIRYCAMPIFHPSYLMRKRDVPQLTDVTVTNLTQVIERAMAYLRVSKGLSPVPLHQEEEE